MGRFSAVTGIGTVLAPFCLINVSVTGGLQTLDPIPPPSGATLLRRFTLLSLATTVVVGVLFGAITARLVEDFALRRQARATAAHVLQIAGTRLSLQDFLLLPPARKSDLDVAMRGLAGKADVISLTVWSREGQILYSNEPAGTADAPPPALLELALGGRLTWQRFAGSPPRLEVFVPVVASGITRPVAVYQVLDDLSDLQPALARLKWSVQLSVILGVLVLYAVLFTIVRAASADLAHKDVTLRQTFSGIIRSLINALDARDMATAHHSSRVADNAVMIARAMGLDEAQVREVQIAGFLHDIGKIGIRDDLLTKHGPLSEKERAVIQQHTDFGYDILGPVPIPEEIKLAVRHSHERWDGQGYPDALAADQIPLAARIVAVADTYEALTTDRPYRKAQAPQKALAMIGQGAGSQFDPTVVDVFLCIWQERAAGQGVQATPAANPVRPHGSTVSSRAG